MISLSFNYKDGARTLRTIAKTNRMHAKVKAPEYFDQSSCVSVINPEKKQRTFSKINIYDQSQIDEQNFVVNRDFKSIQTRKCLSQRIWDNQTHHRLKTQKLIMSCNKEKQLKSNKKIVYLRPKSKHVKIKNGKTESIQQLNIEKKKLDSRPMTAHSLNVISKPEVPASCRRRRKLRSSLIQPKLTFVKKQSIGPW